MPNNLQKEDRFLLLNNLPILVNKHPGTQHSPKPNKPFTFLNTKGKLNPDCYVC
ncbi:hypothetical protein I79_011734 [Cricetulus griseus]|uniref:Uncharacterized protein n=1 Tax=Cricetulus griseus TaxID=10029 RepID=G3HLZ0_CRIGR|nr:hypothetical protein I79_011734 [Cricetulus griseus]